MSAMLLRFSAVDALALKKLAQRLDRPQSRLLREAVRDLLDKYDRQDFARRAFADREPPP